MVPMLRSCGDDTSPAAVASAGKSRAIAPCVETSESVVPEPMVQPPFSERTPRSSRMPRSPTTTFGSNCRRFMFGYRSVPPATSIASRPCSAIALAASASVRGARYVKDGSLIIGSRLEGPNSDRVRRLTERGLDDERLLEREQWQALRADPRRLSPSLQLERLEDLVRGDGHLVDADPERVMDRVGDRRDDGKQRSLPDLLGAERALGIVGLHQDRVDLVRLERGRALVLEHRGLLVQALPEDLLLHQRLADAHVDRALDLALRQKRVQRPPHVVGDPDVTE